MGDKKKQNKEILHHIKMNLTHTCTLHLGRYSSSMISESQQLPLSSTSLDRLLSLSSLCGTDQATTNEKSKSGSAAFFSFKVIWYHQQSS